MCSASVMVTKVWSGASLIIVVTERWADWAELISIGTCVDSEGIFC
jgi:hypothetical protein